MKPSKSIYTLHPGLERVDSALANLKEKTGQSLEEWTVVVKKSGLATVKEQAAWLKAEQGLGRDYAKFVAESVCGRNAYDPDALVEAMFAAKTGLRPIYDRLLSLAMKLGRDVTVTPCATIVPIRRRSRRDRRRGEDLAQRRSPTPCAGSRGPCASRRRQTPGLRRRP